MNNCQMYINGEWCDAASGETYDAINPALGEPFGTIPKGGREDAQRAIAAANEAALRHYFSDQVPWDTVKADPEANPDNFESGKMVRREPQDLPTPER